MGDVICAEERGLQASKNVVDVPMQVLEETSVDIAAKVREENSFEVHVKQQRQKLYIVPEVSPQETPSIPLHCLVKAV